MNPTIQHRQALRAGQLISATSAPTVAGAWVGINEISLLDLYMLRQHAQMGQLSDMDDWLDRQRSRERLGACSQVLLDEVECAAAELDLYAVVEAVDRFLLFCSRSTRQHT
jgi:hypothetical protein